MRRPTQHRCMHHHLPPFSILFHPLPSSSILFHPRLLGCCCLRAAVLVAPPVRPCRCCPLAAPGRRIRHIISSALPSTSITAHVLATTTTRAPIAMSSPPPPGLPSPWACPCRPPPRLSTSTALSPHTTAGTRLLFRSHRPPLPSVSTWHLLSTICAPRRLFLRPPSCAPRL